jgi:hypothetical protein
MKIIILPRQAWDKQKQTQIRDRFLVGGGFLSYSANFAFHEGHKPANSQYTWDLLPFRFKTS